jgi:hypothetical protein
MKIDQHNYETYFLDYLEGRLDPPTITELEGFLAIHPKLKKELESYEEIFIIPETIDFPDKKNLKKFTFDNSLISNKNFEDICIAFGEHLLNPTKINDLFSYIEQHQHRKKEFDLYKKIYLKPQKIVFDNKQAIYKKTISSPQTKTIVRWSSIAAGILAIAGIYSLFIDNHKSTKNPPYSKVSIESKLVPKTLVTPKRENYLVQNNYKKQNLNIKINNKLNNIISIDSLSYPTHRTDEIAYIPTIELTSIENPIDLNSVISLDYNVYYTENDGFKNHNLLKNLAKKLSHNINLLKSTRGKISLIKVAQLGLTGINHLTNSNMQLSEKTDTAGKVTALSFESGLFEYHKIKAD